MKSLINRFLTYGLYFLAVILPFNTKLIVNSLNGANMGEFDRIALFATDLLVVALLLIGLSLKQAPANPRNTPFYWLAWLILIVSCFTVYIAPDKMFVLYAVIRLLIAISLWWLLINADYSKRLLMIFLVVGAALSGALGIGQFLLQDAGANKWLGIAAHRPGDLGVSVIETVNSVGDSERWLRAYGSLDHPNMLGGFLALAIIISAWLPLKNKDKEQDLLIYGLLPLLAGGLFFSFSRSALLAVITGLTILVAVNLKKYKKIIPSLAIILAVWGVFSFSYGYLWWPRLAIDTRLEAKSLTERALYMKDAGALIDRHPLVGNGLGNFTNVVRLNIDNGRASYDYQPVHNTWMLVQAEIGLFGIIFFMSVYIFMVIFSFFTIKVNRLLGGLNLSLLAGLGIILTFDHWLWSLHFGILLFWFLSGLIIRNLGVESAMATAEIRKAR